MPWHHQIYLTQRGLDMPYDVLKLVIIESNYGLLAI